MIRADPERAPESISEGIALFHQIVRGIRRMRQPVIVGVNGAAAGGGLGLALACDFVIAAADASFVPAYTRIGASADGGTTWSVARLLGQRRALEWLMLGDPMNAEVALAAGLINRVVPADSLSAEVDALARRIAAGPVRVRGGEAPRLPGAGCFVRSPVGGRARQFRRGRRKSRFPGRHCRIL